MIVDELRRLIADAKLGDKPQKVAPLIDNNGFTYPTLYETWVFIDPAGVGLWANRGKDLSVANLIAFLLNNASKIADLLEAQ